jgi:hypothetical protein
MVQWLVNTITNFEGSINGGEFLDRLITISFSEGLCCNIVVS